MVARLKEQIGSFIAVAAILATASIGPLRAQSAGISYYAAPNGAASNDGSMARPLDLATALSASSPARPGDTIWLRGGTYTGNFVSVLNGGPGAPVTVRSYPGERATLDSANGSQSPVLSIKGSYAWFWGLEIMNSYPNRTSGASSRGSGVMQFGPYTKLINLVVHDALDGISTWSGVTDGELYGNVLYNNGADSGGVGAGHSIYVQNSTGTKRIVDNVMSNSYNFGIHVYTENGTINNVSMEGNIAFNHGVLAASSSYKANYFIGGSQVAQNPELIANYGYYPWSTAGRNADLGWGTACNNLSMHDNYLAGGTSLKVNCTNAVVSGNWLYGSIAGSVAAAYANNVISNAKPAGVLSVVRPNKYEVGRANIAVYNWDLLPAVAVDLSASGLKPGDGFEIRNAQNFFGPAVVTGTYNGTAVTIPMTGLPAATPIGAASTAPPTGPEFNAFVVLRTGAPSAAPVATLAASPASVTAGQPATLTWTATNATSASITPTVGAVSTSGSVTVMPAQTTTYTLTATGAGGTATKTVTVNVTAGGGTGQSSATFVKTDNTTQGSWPGAYGNDGFQIAGDTTQYPGYAQVSVGGAAAWTWAATTSDVRALQKSSGSGRVAATWYDTGAPLTIDVTLTDGAAHQIALYALDWDGRSRTETIQITDRSTGAVLDNRSASAFTGGSYLVWQLTGSVRISVTRTSGVNAVFSGLFFGGARGIAVTPPPPPPPPPPTGTAAATFVKLDPSTQGSWATRYGADGMALAADTTRLPSYAAVSFAGAANWTWVASTTDVRAVQKSAGPDRVAATWYDTSGEYTVDVNVSDTAVHQFAMYVLDWDSQKRGETIQLTDAATGALLDQRSVSDFQTGVYVVWQIKGSVRVRVTRTQGTNAVVSGLFFG